MHLKSPDEPDNAMILGVVTTGATADTVYVTDNRYYLTKTVSSGDVQELRTRMTEAESQLGTLDDEVNTWIDHTKSLSSQVIRSVKRRLKYWIPERAIMVLF